MIYNVVHWILERIVLYFSVHEENITEHTNGKCHVFTFSVCNAMYHVYTF